MQFFYRSGNGIGVKNTVASDPQVVSSFPEVTGSIRSSKYSPDGKYVAFITSGNELTVLDSETGSTVLTLANRDVQDFSFSPKSSCMCLFEKYVKSSSGNASEMTNNVHIINIVSGKAIFSECLKAPKPFQWTQDETCFARLGSSNSSSSSSASGEVYFFLMDDCFKNGPENTKPTWTLSIEGLSAFSISPAKEGIFVAIFIPERKGYPASVRIYQVPSFNVPIAQKNFFKADRVEFMWNTNGNNLLALSHTDVDSSGKSYYGQSFLYLLSVRGGFDAHVLLDKEGPIHDVTWSPSGKEFIAVYGFMPARIVLFDSKCEKIFDFGENHRNVAKFNPQAKIILIAGFGNLNGNMDFWDRQKLVRLSSTQESGTTYFEWAPDGRHLLTATLSPRLRVDNKYKIWHYCGQAKCEEAFPSLLQVGWKPVSNANTLYPMREISPGPSAQSNRNGKVTSTAPKAYVPPHLRAKLEASQAQAKSKGKAKKTNPTNVVSKVSATVAKSVPVQENSDGLLSEFEKKKRGILKKLRQIDELKEKREKGKNLEINQIAKIDSEIILRKELEALELEEKK